MIGGARLDEHPTAAWPPSRPTRDLSDELKRPLARAKVGEVQSRIRVDHSHYRDVGKIQSLRDHLRAEQDIDLTRGHALEDLMVRPFARGGVEIHACNPRARIPRAQEMLELLRAQAAEPLGLVATDPADLGHRLLVPAVMAA